MDYVYKETRPRLTIEHLGGQGLGRCYSASYWLVTSTRRLSKEILTDLNHIGVLGFGQEFFIHSPCDGKEEPAGIDQVPCVGMEGEKIVDEHPNNPYTGKPYGSSPFPYYQYRCESRVDSSD